MSAIQLKLSEIIAARSNRSRAMESEISKWQAYRSSVDNALAIVRQAEHVNPDVHGSSARLDEVSRSIDKILEAYTGAKKRFDRDSLCIGVGGAARMGKSTFLQSVTGLAETQIPTSDKYFTTATRSQIVNSPNENVAIADFHSVQTFLAKVIGPMCDAIGASRPVTLADFRYARYELSHDHENSQEARDALERLEDAQSELSSYERYLTGERGRVIQLDELRPFVAYPGPKNDKLVKAGPFLAVADIVIRVAFPSTDVAQLKVVDLPGLGEAGRNLAKVQTDGLSDICDITLFVKRPTDGNIEWNDVDTKALDAMGEAVPLLDDQTKYTAILANVDLKDEERTRLFLAAQKSKLKKRPFEIIECDARDRELVINDTMPRILDFMARNLPYIDNAIISRLQKDAEGTLLAIRREVGEVANSIRQVAPAGEGQIDFAANLLDRVVEVLTERERQTAKNSIGNDKDWDDEVERVHGEVIKWVNGGCGYGSRDNLLEAIRKEIMRDRAQPSHVINQCRVKFRAEWEVMDMHLTNRIARLLSDAMDSLQGVMHSFVPDRKQAKSELESVRIQILEFADRIDSRHTDLGDDIALSELSAPLRRIAEFDLQFRFHLEPMLHATTHLLVANELPLVKDENDAEKFLESLLKKLTEAADAYAGGMRKSGTGNSGALERKKKLFEKAIPDAAIRADVINILEQSMGAAQSFCPNRIFAAVMETFADAFIRSKDSQKAFQILAREWKNELMPAPDEKTRLTNASAGVMSDLVKKLQK